MNAVLVDVVDEMDAATDYAATFGIELAAQDFDVTDGWVFIDGTDPIEWIEDRAREAGKL